MPENYYAYADKADQSGSAVFLEFHCLREAAIGNLLYAQVTQFQGYVDESQALVITFASTQEDLWRRLDFKEEITDMESRWYRLSTNENDNGLPATLFQGDNDGAPISVNRLNRLDEETDAQLHKQTAIDDVPDATTDEIDGLLGRYAGPAEFIAVYQVGQGNCNAICEDNGVPLLYFDLGGGCFQNKHTYHKALRFCFTGEPVVLLSHWDTDHYESAKRYPQYQQKTWIVPRQPFGPAHLKYFRQLQAKGKVYVWPLSLSAYSFAFGTLVRCNHPDPKKKNHTGLALAADLSPHSNTIRKVLLPADAAYTWIPGYATTLCDGLAATHHGAEFDHANSPVPSPCGLSALAYSYGVANTYGHPRTAALTAHTHTAAKHTTAGHIALSDCPFHNQACGGKQCDLQVVQYF